MIDQADAFRGHTLIECPICGGNCRIAMLPNACAFFHECECCGARLRPHEGDYCVVCSYGAGPCLPRQAEAGAGSP
jgi:hypothetical protein